MIQQLIFGVDHLHSMGFVHRNLRPENVFLSGDPQRPLIIAGHEYTTQLANTNVNFNLPDNPYSVKIKNGVAGSRKLDYASIGGIVMAWQCGVDDYAEHMKNGKNRIANVK